MRTPITLRAFALNLFGAGPALGRAQHNHRPARSSRRTIAASFGFDALNLTDDGVESFGHQVMHRSRLGPPPPIRRVAIAAEKLLQLFVTDPGKNGGTGDLVAVEMKDRQNRAVRCWVQELIGMPARCQRPGFSLAIADDAGNDQIWVVERRSIGVRNGVAELSALMDGSGRLGCYVAGDATGKRKLFEYL